jgi:hypothetical protein
MYYNIAGPTTETTLQFYIHFTDEELELYKLSKNGKLEYEYFEETVLDRVLCVLHSTTGILEDNQICGCITTRDLVLRDVNENVGLIIAMFSNVFDIDKTCEYLPNSIFSQILHGRGYADLRLSDYYKEYSNEPVDNNVWTMWGYKGLFQKTNPEDDPEYKIEERIWPPPKDYEPFITYKDYKNWNDADDSLDNAINVFREHFPVFLRKMWGKKYENDIRKIEESPRPLECFNKSINYPSNEGYALIDSLFTNVSDDDFALLHPEILQIISYFYHINFH